jgi:hypothetical protein
MINTRYASIKVGFHANQNTGWEKVKANRARLGQAMASTQSALSASTNAFSSAQQDKISGLATLAAKAAIARVQADAKAKKEDALAKIDGAQKAVDDAKAVSKSNGTTIIGNTIIQKYVSWALTPAVDTTA